MTWLHIVDGMCASIQLDSKHDDIEELVDALESSTEYRDLCTNVKNDGLFIGDSIDYDGWSISIFLGAELHEDRHIYQGQTIVCPLSAFNEGQLEKYEGLLELVLARVLKKEFSVKKGIIVNQFD